MYKLFTATICLLALLAVGCNKSTPAESPNAKLQGPSNDQMMNTYNTTAKTRGGGPPQGMMGRPGGGAPYGSGGGSAPYGGGGGAPYGGR